MLMVGRAMNYGAGREKAHGRHPASARAHPMTLLRLSIIVHPGAKLLRSPLLYSVAVFEG